MEKKRLSDETGLEPHELALRASELAYNKLGEDITILDLRKFSIGCDYFVIVSAKSVPHLKAIYEEVDGVLRKKWRERPWHSEGVSSERWILLDFVHVVVHIFHEEARQFYMIERLWGDAPAEKYPPANQAAESIETIETDEGALIDESAVPVVKNDSPDPDPDPVEE